MVVLGGVKDFLGKPAPPGYVPGLGRGASGFTTRADIGPGREQTEADQQQSSQQQDDNEQYENNNNNEFGLLGTTPLDKEDEEADKIWDSIDAQMDARRKSRREAKERARSERTKDDRPKIQEQFSDLKRDLATMSESDWESIPEPGDLIALSRKSKRAREREKEREVYTATSDILLNSARNKLQSSNSVVDTEADGVADIRQISEARDNVLKVKLDQMSTGGKSTVDPRGYLTDLNSINIKSETEIGDMKKARELLKSVIETNPKHAAGWIAAARVDEIDGRLGAAREKMQRACEHCPGDEDVWLEAARLQTPHNARVILAKAVQELPKSSKLWLQAMHLESDQKVKKRILRKALEFQPSSEKLWKAAVELEDDPADARIILARSVECLPQSIDLWLALARLETYQQAKIVLNRGRKANPTSHEIWLAAAQLEETAGDDDGRVSMLITRAMQTLASNGVHLGRDRWLSEAERMENCNSIKVCHSIITSLFSLPPDDGEEEDWKSMWLSQADSMLKRGSLETARAIYSELFKAYPDDHDLWLKAVLMERDYGTRKSMDELLEMATNQQPHLSKFWLLRVENKWKSGDFDGARQVMNAAFKANPESEDVWLAAVNLEIDSKQFDRAKELLKRARETTKNSSRVWLKSAVLSRKLGDTKKALEYAEKALEMFPSAQKLWMVKAQIEQIDMGDVSKARDSLIKAVKHCPNAIPLWIQASRLEELTQNLTRSRAILDKARLINPKNDRLWLESVELEQRLGSEQVAKTVMAKALQECPNSGLLWQLSILMEPRPSRKSRSVDALKKCDNDAMVVVVVARLFWQERSIEKARSWFNRAIKINDDLGDSWAWFYKFECEHGSSEQQADVLRRFTIADPKHGLLWPSIRKDPKNFQVSIVDLLKNFASELK